MAKDILQNPTFRIIAVLAIIVIIVGFATNWTFGFKKKGLKEGDDCVTDEAVPRSGNIRNGVCVAGGGAGPVDDDTVTNGNGGNGSANAGRMRSDCSPTDCFTKGGLWSKYCCKEGSARINPSLLDKVSSCPASATQCCVCRCGSVTVTNCTTGETCSCDGVNLNQGQLNILNGGGVVRSGNNFVMLNIVFDNLASRNMINRNYLNSVSSAAVA